MAFPALPTSLTLDLHPLLDRQILVELEGQEILVGDRRERPGVELWHAEVSVKCGGKLKGITVSG